jgi:hypothetical protein
LLAAQREERLNIFGIGRLTALLGLLELWLQLTNLLLQVVESGVRRIGGQRLAEIGFDVGAVAAGIQAR